MAAAPERSVTFELIEAEDERGNETSVRDKGRDELWVHGTTSGLLAVGDVLSVAGEIRVTVATTLVAYVGKAIPAVAGKRTATGRPTNRT